jgi:hypothetical protein
VTGDRDEALVETAARELWRLEYRHAESMDDEPQEVQDGVRSDARVVLAAVLPAVRDAARREAAEAALREAAHAAEVESPDEGVSPYWLEALAAVVRERSISMHDAQAVLAAVLPAVRDAARREALQAAADAARGMHDPVAPDCEEWASWLEARAHAPAAPDTEEGEGRG